MRREIARLSISIHAPPRGATAAPRQRDRGAWHFNSRPSARGDHAPRRHLPHGAISIHAPPRGATGFKEAQAHTIKIFQFTPLREGRRRHAAGSREAHCISIHAPPRGATCIENLLHTVRDISIHAPPRGATSVNEKKPPLEKFQFTPLREGRHEILLLFYSRRRFQFTPLREGRRRHAAGSREAHCISIHAPPRGATGGTVVNRWQRRGISIHAPPRGATGNTSVLLEGVGLFQFTPLREGRLQKI